MALNPISRRDLLAGAAVAGVVMLSSDVARADDPRPKDAQEALERLKAGNKRFVEGKTQHAHQSADWRKHLVADQKPFATILGCSDSRVPPELVFDQGFGDLFIIRVAGNIVAPDILGSLAYAIEHLSCQLIVVLGHQNCGAVTAALEALSRSDLPAEPKAIKELLKLIEPGLKGVNRNLPKVQRVAAGVDANVQWSLRQLSENPAAKKLIDERKLLLVGAVYELDSGTVRFRAN